MKLIKKEFIFERVPFEEFHASTVVLYGNSKLAAWLGGEKEGKNDVCIWYSRYENGIWSYNRKTIAHAEIEL